MKVRDREKIILEILQEKQLVSVDELSRKFGVSVVTIRKDLQHLEDEGKLVRTFGGAAAGGVESREQQRLEAIDRIAARTAEEIRDGDCVILNAGSTTLLTARKFQKLRGLTVITNSVSIARELSVQKEIQLILLGGEMTANAVFTHGGAAIGQLEQYKADKVILSASGISCRTGITTRHMEAADLFHKMIERADEVFVVADDTKVGFESFYYVSDLKVADKIITNRCEASEAELCKMEKMGIEVIRC